MNVVLVSRDARPHGRLSYRWPHWAFLYIFFPVLREGPLDSATTCPRLSTHYHYHLSLAYMYVRERRAVDGPAESTHHSILSFYHRFSPPHALASEHDAQHRARQTLPSRSRFANEKKTDFRAIYVTIRRQRLSGITTNSMVSRRLRARARVSDFVITHTSSVSVRIIRSVHCPFLAARPHATIFALHPSHTSPLITVMKQNRYISRTVA